MIRVDRRPFHCRTPDNKSSRVCAVGTANRKAVVGELGAGRLRRDFMHRTSRANALVAGKRSHWAVPAALAAIGAFAFVVGALVYAADRDPAHATLFSNSFALDSGPIFGVLGPWLPSFVHPFAFSLFTAAARQRCATPAYGACAAWWAVNIAFEAGQHAHISGRLAETLQFVFGHTWLTRALSNYFLRGSFDVADIVAATAGALVAAVVLYLVHQLELQRAH